MSAIFHAGVRLREEVRVAVHQQAAAIEHARLDVHR
jgi:hypothetical protein